MNDSLFDVSGERVLVTGASLGLGKRFARCLAERGAKVAIAARSM
ncbi:MAG: SDR family NAD(P)-dependent oxidoreductase, partial [Rhodospirillaceae bacterium]|nr:SDR family NAD(P)-dependent oxidoreductase [Rhodospirillaceae bacterium]